MKLDLEVITSTSIKRKKPWPRFIWLGVGREEEKNESLFMVDRQRISTLHLPSGRSKKKIPRLQPHLCDAVATTDVNGPWFGGIQYNGDIFLWHKDSDHLWWIKGIPELVTYRSENDHEGKENRRKGFPYPRIAISSSGHRIVVVMGLYKTYIWQGASTPRPGTTTKGSWLPGKWLNLPEYSSVLLPNSECRETFIQASFLCHYLLGEICIISFIFNFHETICITFGVIHNLNPVLISSPKPSLDMFWHTVRLPFHSIGSECHPIRRKGAFITKFSHDAMILGAAVNQYKSESSRLLFVSPFSGSRIPVDFKGSGATQPMLSCARSYWIGDLAWTADDAYLVGVTRQGSLCIFTRLGESLLLTTSGCSMDFGPSYFITLHPLVTVIAKGGKNDTNSSNHPNDTLHSTLSGEVMLQQRYSVSTHPQESIILVSDGYLVTCLQIPCSSFGLTRVLTSLQMHCHQMLYPVIRKYSAGNSSGNPAKKSVTFSETDSKFTSGIRTRVLDSSAFLLSSQTSESSLEADYSQTPCIWDGVNGLDSRKITFGDPVTFDTTLSEAVLKSTSIRWEAHNVAEGLKTLIAIWGILASVGCPWTVTYEQQACFVVDMLGKLFQFVLDSDIEAIDVADKTVKMNDHQLGFLTTQTTLSALFCILVKFISMLLFDTVQFNLLPSILKLINATVQLVLSSEVLKSEMTTSQIIHSVYSLLEFTETFVQDNLSYQSLPLMLCHCNCNNNVFYTCHNFYLPFIIHSQDDSNEEITSEYKSGQRNNDRGDLFRWLLKSWECLYSVTVKYYEKSASSTLGGNLYEDALKCLCQIQKHLQNSRLLLKIEKRKNQTPSLKEGGISLHVKGRHSQARKLWMKKLSQLLKKNNMSEKQQRLVSRYLHCILYSLLIDNQIRAAAEYINILLATSNGFKVNVSSQREQYIFLTVNQEHKGVMKVVKSFAIFFGAYFVNELPYVHPVHQPRPLSSLLCRKYENTGVRKIFICREEITSCLTREGLSEVLTPSYILELLLQMGQWSEAVWLAHRVNDWKTAVVLSVTWLHGHSVVHNKEGCKCQIYKIQKLFTEIIRTKVMEYLAVEAHPGISSSEVNLTSSPRKGTLQGVWSRASSTSSSEEQVIVLRELLIPTVLCGLPILSQLLEDLLDQLWSVLSGLPLLVDNSVHLPAPPLYCPQQDHKDNLFNGCHVQEHKDRQVLAHLVQSILILLRATGMMTFVVQGYLEDIRHLWQALV